VIGTAYELGNPPGRDLLLSALNHVPPRLDLAALAIARLGTPTLDNGPSLARLDALAASVADRLQEGPIAALTGVLAGDEGFEGDRVTYDLAANSYLDQVLERRRGLPIALSVVYLEVARRVGLEASGVALPGHFVVQVAGTVLDPFNSGKKLSAEACDRIVKRASPSASFSEEMLRPPSVRAIATRMINNLKGSWLQRAQTDKALCAVDLLLSLTPNHPSELRLRAGLLMELGAFRAALSDIEKCLAEQPTPPDFNALVKAAEGLRDRVGQLH
jgi:regulator of sirC expression with transglutaminase-like and TPR domain